MSHEYNLYTKEDFGLTEEQNGSVLAQIYFFSCRIKRLKIHITKNLLGANSRILKTNKKDINSINAIKSYTYRRKTLLNQLKTDNKSTYFSAIKAIKSREI